MKIKSKKLSLTALVVGISLSTISTVSVAEEKNDKGKVGSSALGGNFYYEIGGGSKIKRRKNRTIPIGGGIEWHNNLMCGDFDASLSVTNLLNGITGEMEKLADDMIASATGVISSWGWMEIARSDPQLYEMMQQGKIEAGDIFSASVESCEAMTQKMITNGNDELSGWVEVSGYEDWMSSSENAENTDVVQLEENVNKNKGENGVTWIGGEKKGGKNQEPIEVEKDAIRAGYNQLANRDSTSKSTLSKDENTPWYVEYWSTPEEAEKWITGIVGTTQLRTCQDCDRLQTTPGKGVYGVLEEEQFAIEEEIFKLLESPTSYYSKESLEKISAPGFEITQPVIEALSDESGYKSSFIEKLSEEVATASVIEKLIAGRRILISGKREAYIAQNDDAVEILNERIDELTGEMNLLKQDAELRNITRNSIAVNLLERKRVRDSGRSDKINESTSNAIRKVTGRN